MADLTGSCALITGAAKRIGRAVSLAFAEAGADVILHANNSLDAAEDTATEIRSLGVKASVIQADLGEEDQAQGLLPEALAAAGKIDILVNNAAIFPESRVLAFTAEDLQQVLQINALAPLTLSRAFSEHAEEGVIINLLDTRIQDYDQEHAAYHLSKRMLFTLTRMLALELSPRFRVNGVAPGLILPPPGEDESYLQRLAHTNPLKRSGEVSDVAGAALFLATNSFVTGQIIYVDGGRHMRGGAYG